MVLWSLLFHLVFLPACVILLTQMQVSQTGLKVLYFADYVCQRVVQISGNIFREMIL